MKNLRILFTIGISLPFTLTAMTINSAELEANCGTTWTICDAAWPQDYDENGIDSNYAGFAACMTRNGCY